MKATTSWKEKMSFVATMDKHSIAMDAKAPIGNDSAATPKQLLLASISGCTGMDVVALLRKHKQSLSSLVIDSEAETTDTHPMIFREVFLRFRIEGEVSAEKAIEAVELSQSKYCGVSAMVSKATPIRYEIEINGKKIAEGKAHFST